MPHAQGGSRSDGIRRRVERGNRRGGRIGAVIARESGRRNVLLHSARRWGSRSEGAPQGLAPRMVWEGIGEDMG